MFVICASSRVSVYPIDAKVLGRANYLDWGAAGVRFNVAVTRRPVGVRLAAGALATRQ